MGSPAVTEKEKAYVRMGSVRAASAVPSSQNADQKSFASSPKLRAALVYTVRIYIESLLFNPCNSVSLFSIFSQPISAFVVASSTILYRE
jgi:hypothetical protein